MLPGLVAQQACEPAAAGPGPHACGSPALSTTSSGGEAPLIPLKWPNILLGGVGSQHGAVMCAMQAVSPYNPGSALYGNQAQPGGMWVYGFPCCLNAAVRWPAPAAAAIAASPKLPSCRKLVIRPCTPILDWYSSIAAQAESTAQVPACGPRLLQR